MLLSRRGSLFGCSFRRPGRRPRPAARLSAERLEDRSLLSATFALDGTSLRLEGFTQTTDEDLTVRENGANYEFALSEGTWVGADGGGVSGAGTAVLVVDKAAVAGLAGGIDVDGSAVTADVALGTADFSTLTGGLVVGGAGRLTQSLGATLTVSSFASASRTVSLAGVVSGGAGPLSLLASWDIDLAATARLSTTSGDVALRAEGAGVTPNVAAAVLSRGARVVSQTGSILISGRGSIGRAGVSFQIQSLVASDGGAIEVVAAAGSVTGAGRVTSSPGGTVTVSAAGDVLGGSFDAGPDGTVAVTADTDGDGTGGISIGSVAARLAMRAAGPISAGTRVGFVEAESRLSDVKITNEGALTIGGADGTLSGVRAAGTVWVKNTGSVSVTREGETLAAGDQVFVEALGAGADIVTGGSNSVRLGGRAAAEGRSVLLHAGRDVLVGDAGSGSAGDVRGGLIQVRAGRDVLVDVGSALDAIPFANVFPFPGFSVEAGRDLRYLATGGVTGASSETAGIGIAIGVGGVFVADSGAAVVLSTTAGGQAASIDISANDMTINGGIDAGRDPLRSVVTLVPQIPATGRRDTVLGADRDPADPAAGVLGLTDAELDRVTAQLLRVRSGGFDSTIRIADVHTQAGSGYVALSLYAYGGIVDATPGEQADLIVDSLTLQTWTGSVAPVGALGDDIDIATATLAVRATGDIAIESWGTVTVGVGDERLGLVPSPGPLQGIFSESGDVLIVARGADADLIVDRPVTAGRGVQLRAADSIRFTASGAVAARGGASLIANGDDLAGDSGDVVTMADGAAIDAGAGRILVTTAGAAVDAGGTGGRITLGRLVTTYGVAGETDAAVTILTDADVVDGGDVGGPDIRAVEGLLVIDAAHGVGSSLVAAGVADAAIDTDVGGLLVTNRASGDVAVDEYDGVTIHGIDQRAETGDVRVDANADLTSSSERIYALHGRVAIGWSVREYRSDGLLVREWPVPWPLGYSREPRDLAVDGSGRVHLVDAGGLIDGTPRPALLTLDTKTGVFTETPIPEWVPGLGSIAAIGDRLFLLDTGPPGVARLIRYDAATGDVSRVSESLSQDTYGYSHVAAGLDGRIYALGTQKVGDRYYGLVTVYDAQTLAVARRIRLDVYVGGIAADATGNLFGLVAGTVYRFDATGRVTAQLPLPRPAWGDWTAIDIDPDGTTLVASVGRTSPGAMMAVVDTALQSVRPLVVAESERFRTTFGREPKGRLVVGGPDAAGAGVTVRHGDVFLVSRGPEGDILLAGAVRTDGPSDADAAAGGSVTLSAGRAVKGGGPSSSVSATSFRVTAAAGVGSASDPLRVQLAAGGRLDADGGTGEVYVRSGGPTTVGTLGGGRILLDVAGAVVLDGSHLDIGRPDVDGLTPVAALVIVANDGTDPVAGTFVGLPEGAAAGTAGGRSARISYRGGDGNDIVLALDRDPVARPDEARTGEPRPVAGNLLTNDSDPEAAPLAVSAVNGAAAAVGRAITLASGAKLTVNADGSYLYDPAGAFVRLRRGETAADSFAYTASDSHGGSSTATVTVTIEGGGNEADLIGYSGGEWHVAASNGSAFADGVAATWSNAAWEALRQGDFDGDGRTDALGLLKGEWYVGLARTANSGLTYFATSRWGAWNPRAAWEHVLVGDVDGDGRDDVVAEVGGDWYGARSTGSAFGLPARLARTSDAAWDLAALADTTGDGKDDLALVLNGDWYVGASTVTPTGVAFLAASRWARMGTGTYQLLTLADLNADGNADAIGFIGGEWRTGMSNGANGFASSLRAKWASTTWLDPLVGDFDGDGTTDLAARYGGQWYVGLSNSTGGEASRSRWATWNNLAWKDVRAGDFDGDGRADVAGRYDGDWYVARSTGSGFATARWGRWNEAAWRAVAAGDTDGSIPPVSAGASSFAGGSSLASASPGLRLAPAAFAAPSEDDPLTLFWAKAGEDDRLAAGLLGAR